MVETLSVQERLEQEPNLLHPLEAEAFLQLLEMGRIDKVTSWRSPAVERRPGSHIQGEGLFAAADIPAHMLVAIKTGRALDSREVNARAPIIQGSQQQITPDRFLAGRTAAEVDRNLVGYNHACDPNARVLLFKGASLAFLATDREVAKGEELTVDYSVSEMSNLHFMICDCGAPECRGIVAPLWDWENPGFQADHGAEFSWFIQDAIAEQQELGAEALAGQHRFHELLKLAGGLRLLDKMIMGLEGDRERQLAQVVVEEWRPAMEEDWAQTAEAGKLKRYGELRLEAAARFAQLYPLLGSEELGISRGGFLPDMKIDRAEAMETMHERVEPHLAEITDLATDLANEFNHDFER